jgi:hypothetical protein
VCLKDTCIILEIPELSKIYYRIRGKGIREKTEVKYLSKRDNIKSCGRRNGSKSIFKTFKMQQFSLASSVPKPMKDNILKI